jgi:hypothetical protein
MGKKSGSRSGIRIRDEQPGLYFLELRIENRNYFLGLKCLNSLLWIGIRDGKNSDAGSGREKSRIRDVYPGSETLVVYGLPAIFFHIFSVFSLRFARTRNTKF